MGTCELPGSGSLLRFTMEGETVLMEATGEEDDEDGDEDDDEDAPGDGTTDDIGDGRCRRSGEQLKTVLSSASFVFNTGGTEEEGGDRVGLLGKFVSVTDFARMTIL